MGRDTEGTDMADERAKRTQVNLAVTGETLDTIEELKRVF